MMDKIKIVAQNYFKSNCKDLREELEELLREVYIRGYSDGAEKMKMCLRGTTNE